MNNNTKEGYSNFSSPMFTIFDVSFERPEVSEYPDYVTFGFCASDNDETKFSITFHMDYVKGLDFKFIKDNCIHEYERILKAKEARVVASNMIGMVL